MSKKEIINLDESPSDSGWILSSDQVKVEVTLANVSSKEDKKLVKSILTVRVADTPELAQKGLMTISSLDPDTGLLINMSNEDGMMDGLWMKDTSVPLSAAFLNEHGIILEIVDLNPYDESIKEAPPGTMYALEVSRGWFDNTQAKVGHQVFALDDSKVKKSLKEVTNALDSN